jgi:hypothetical protein
LRPKASENPGAECLTNVEVELGEIHDRGETGEKLTFKGTRREGDTGRGGSHPSQPLLPPLCRPVPRWPAGTDRVAQLPETNKPALLLRQTEPAPLFLCASLFG